MSNNSILVLNKVIFGKHSSFDARLHLLKTSDIDISCLVMDFDASKKKSMSAYLESLGYKFSEVRNENDKKMVHYVY